MLHFDPSEISHWAECPNATHQLPELIRRLILATTPMPTRLDIPGGSAVWRSGWDGLVEAVEGNAWVPTGASAWELSCQREPGTKASADYRKRTDDPQGVASAGATFVSVTPRQWIRKRKWEDERRNEGRWADVRAYDASDLATWLEQAPAVAAWFARLIGKLPAGGYTTLEDWWENWATVSWPNISPQLVLAGRQESADKLGEWMQQPPAHYYVQGQTREEAIAFVAASTLNSDDAGAVALLAKTLVVKSKDAWRSLTSHVSPLVLLREFDGNVSPQVAVDRGHHVITPLYASEETKGNKGKILRRIGRDETVTALAEMGLSETKARALARKTARMLPIIRRYLIDEAGGPRPAWASPTANAAQSALPALVLVGQWNERNEADQEAIARIAATPYDGIANEVANLAQTEDSPLTKIGAHWRFLCHEEAWHLLAPRLAATAIKRFQETAIDVLSAVSPKFGMPISERHLADIYGQTLPHSGLLRDGIARTLALMGSQGERAQNVPNASDVPERILQRVFAENAGWEIWATLGNILPTLAEAAPEAVLSAIEQRMAATPNPFGSLFAQEGDPLFGGSVHTGLLWALERLAWTPEYFTRTAAILAQLAAIDPGGTISNRPARSLRAMFLPWFRVSETPDAHRLETLEMLLKRHPEPSWRALINAYPSPPVDTVVEHTPPTWRPWGQDGATRPTRAECHAFVKVMERLLLEYVGHDPGRWQDVVGIISSLSPGAYQGATDLMKQRISAIKAHPEYVALWAQLRQELNRHRSFPDAKWAMPAAKLESLAAIYERLTPAAPVQAYSWVFDQRPILPEKTSRKDIEAYEEEKEQYRQKAIIDVYARGGTDAVLSCALAVTDPEAVGWACTMGIGTEFALDLAVPYAGSDNRNLAKMARGALRAIYLQSGWVALEVAIARLKAVDAHSPAVAEIFLAAHATPSTWERLAAENTEVQRRYWEQLNSFYASKNDEAGIRFVAERLLEVKRSPAVVDWIAYKQVHHEIVIRTLEQLPDDLAADKAPELRTAGISHGIAKLLDDLDESSAVGDDVIARLELPLLPALPYGWRPNLAIYRVISNDPALFADLVASASKRNDGQIDTTSAEPHPIGSAMLAQIIMGKGVVPGKMKDDSVDYESLSNWVSEARRLCAERGRAEIGDEYIGHLLAKSPDGEDGLWPCEPVREVLELLGAGAQHIGNGFVIGKHNLRGVTTRSMFAGGDQEHTLTDKYQEQASMMASKWPHTATLLRRIADGYKREAQWYDQESDELDQFGF